MADLWEASGGVFWSSPPLLPSVDFLRDFGWFPFCMTVVATLAGAFAGAWAAQRNSEKSKRIDYLKKEVQVSNRGIMLALSAINVALAIKKQYVRDLKEQYDSELARLDLHRNQRPLPQEPFHAILMLHQLQPMNIPIEALQNVVMEQSSDKALRAVTSLSESVELLNNAIIRRNDLIEDFKSRRVPEGYTVDAMYFGLPVSGSTNKEYSSTVSGIYLYNNDVIFFSLKLCEYLREHALKVALKYKEISGATISVSQFDMSAAIDQGLFPNDPTHREWENSFTDDSNDIVAKRKWYSL